MLLATLQQAASVKGERKPDCRRLGVSGREEVEATSRSDSFRSLVVRRKRNEILAQRSRVHF